MKYVEVILSSIHMEVLAYAVVPPFETNPLGVGTPKIEVVIPRFELSFTSKPTDCWLYSLNAGWHPPL